MALPLSDVRDVYEDAVERFRHEKDTTFAAPELEAATSLSGDTALQYNSPSHVMRVEPAAVSDPGELEEEFIDSFDAAYEQVLDGTTHQLTRELDTEYDCITGQPGEHDIRFSDVKKDYDVAIDPAFGDLIVDEPMRRHVNLKAGAVTDMLRGRIRQQVAHSLLHKDGLHDEPGLKPYWIYSEDDAPVMSEHGAREAFDEAVEAFQNKYDGRFEPPELVVAEAPYRWNREENRVTVDARLLPELNHETLKDEFTLTFKTFYDEALHAGLDQAESWVKDLYGLADGIEVKEAFFKDLDGSAANYSRSSKIVRLDEKYMDRFNLETGRFETMKPDSSRVHEVEHGRDYQHNPHTGTWRSERYGTGMWWEDDDKPYKEDIRNVAQEIKTTFVQWLFGHTDGRTNVHRAVEDPWHMPAFFEGYTDLYGPRDKGTVRDPYGFGLFTARSVLHGFVNKHGPETGLDLTLDFLQSVTTTPEGLQGTLERSMDLRDVPNYPRMLLQYRNALEAADPHAPGVREAATTLEQQFHAADTEDEYLRAYLQGSALVNAYDTVYPDADTPGPLTTLDVRAGEAWEAFASPDQDPGDHPEWLEDALNNRLS